MQRRVVGGFLLIFPLIIKERNGFNLQEQIRQVEIVEVTPRLRIYKLYIVNKIDHTWYGFNRFAQINCRIIRVNLLNLHHLWSIFLCMINLLRFRNILSHLNHQIHPHSHYQIPKILQIFYRGIRTECYGMSSTYSGVFTCERNSPTRPRFFIVPATRFYRTNFIGK